MDRVELARRFAHAPPSSEDIVRAHEAIRRYCATLADWMNNVLPETPEKVKALDAVDLASMHANAAVARTQTVVAQTLEGGINGP